MTKARYDAKVVEISHCHRHYVPAMASPSHRTSRATCGSIAGLRGSGNLRKFNVCGVHSGTRVLYCGTIWKNDSRAKCGQFWFTFGHFWSEMSEVRPLNNKEKRNKDREALKVDGPKLQARHSSLARGEGTSCNVETCRNIETPHEKNRNNTAAKPVCFLRPRCTGASHW